MTFPSTSVSVPRTWPADDLSANEQLVGPHASGVNSILPKEHGSQFFYLPIIKHSDEEVIDPPLSVPGHQVSAPASGPVFPSDALVCFGGEDWGLENVGCVFLRSKREEKPMIQWGRVSLLALVWDVKPQPLSWVFPCPPPFSCP